MDLDSLKGKTIDDALLDSLKKHVGGLETKAETAEAKARNAQKESAEGRTTLKANLQRALEKLGIDSPEDLDNLPDAKGQAEASRQATAKASRLERELAEKAKAYDDLTSKYSTERRERAIAEQVAKHPFVDADDARALITARVVAEGDELLFRTPEGKSVPLADGVAWMAKSKPHLVKPSGDTNGGSGYRAAGGVKPVNPWAKETFNVTQQVELLRSDPAAAAQMKTAAATPATAGA